MFLYKLFLIFCRFIPISWLADALKIHAKSYMIVVMHEEIWAEEKGGKNDGLKYYEGKGLMTYHCTPEFCRAVFNELDKNMAINHLIKDTWK